MQGYSCQHLIKLLHLVMHIRPDLKEDHNYNNYDNFWGGGESLPCMKPWYLYIIQFPVAHNNLQYTYQIGFGVCVLGPFMVCTTHKQFYN